MRETTYTCEECGGVFEYGWSEEEAVAERESTFPDLLPEDAACVCDDCYKRLMREHGRSATPTPEERPDGQ